MDPSVPHEFDPEKFKELLVENNKKQVKKPVRKLPPVAERPSRDRLKEYNKVLAKRHRRQKVHDTMFDLLAIFSFLMIIYLVAR
jgi:hypothetical protein